ncbi:YceD family protein [Marinifilum sp.]|uniref:YceD family protein n=1 Tax=Marinifilum sp. TaxID=2033137 RepID=UPI003BAB41BB
MEYLSKYTIPFKGLKDGLHEFEFKVDRKFFAYFQEDDVYQAEADVKVSFNKKTLVTTLEFKLKGSLKVACDRCLEDLEIKVEGENSLHLKFGEEHEELADDVIVLAESENEINVAQYIYELFELSLPLSFVHPDDEDGNSTCNEIMIQKLNDLSVNEEEKIDPRWNELRKLIDNN